MSVELKRHRYQLVGLLNRLCSYRHGYLYVDGSFVTDVDEIASRDGRDIVIQSPFSVDDNMGGMCHDMTVYVRCWLEVNSIGHRCVYVESDKVPELPTHSFVIIEESFRRWRVIDVFSTVYAFSDEFYATAGEAIEEWSSKWVLDEGLGEFNNSAFVLDVMPFCGMTIEQFMATCRDGSRAEIAL